MEITLACPWTDPAGTHHAADSTVDVADDAARQLLRDGHARLPVTAGNTLNPGPRSEPEPATPAPPAQPVKE